MQARHLHVKFPLSIMSNSEKIIIAYNNKFMLQPHTHMHDCVAKHWMKIHDLVQ